MPDSTASRRPARSVSPLAAVPLLASIEHALGMLVEIPAALLVVAEIVILFAGVVARYVLAPAADLVGRTGLDPVPVARDARRRGRVPPRRAHADDGGRRQRAARACAPISTLVATVAALAFLLLIAWPAYEYAYEESYITTPALQIANIWRAAALPVGIALMALFALLRLAAAGDARDRAGARSLSVALVDRGVLAAAAGSLKPLGNLNLIIFFVGVVGVCVFAGVPIAFAFGARDLRLSGADHAHAADGPGRPHGRGHVPPHPAVGAAVRVPRPADRDDRHGARHGGVPGEPARPCPRRAALRAGRRDVPGLGHLRLEGRRHGGRGAGAVSGDEGARRQAGRPGRAARRRPARRPRPFRRASC